MKTMKLKALAVAVVGLAAGNAMAVCPTASTATPGGGAWTSQYSLAGNLTIAGVVNPGDPPGGLDGSDCRLDAKIVTNAGGAGAYVRFNDTVSEDRVRGRFLVDVDAFTGLNSIQSVKLLSVNSNTSYQNIAEVFKLNLFGNLAGTTKVLGVVAACEGEPSNICSSNYTLGAGVNTIQFDWQRGNPATLRVWVHNATEMNAYAEANPDVTLTGKNTAGWVANYWAMGLSTPSSSFRSSQLNRVAKFDAADFRRSTWVD